MLTAWKRRSTLRPQGQQQGRKEETSHMESRLGHERTRRKAQSTFTRREPWQSKRAEELCTMQALAADFILYGKRRINCVSPTKAIDWRTPKRKHLCNIWVPGSPGLGSWSMCYTDACSICPSCGFAASVDGDIGPNPLKCTPPQQRHRPKITAFSFSRRTCMKRLMGVKKSGPSSGRYSIVRGF